MNGRKILRKAKITFVAEVNCAKQLLTLEWRLEESKLFSWVDCEDCSHQCERFPRDRFHFGQLLSAIWIPWVFSERWSMLPRYLRDEEVPPSQKVLCLLKLERIQECRLEEEPMLIAKTLDFLLSLRRHQKA